MDSTSDLLDPVVGATLRSGEQVIVAVRSFLPLQRETTNTFAGLHAARYLVRAFTHRRRLARRVAEYSAVGMPVARRMLLVITSDRMLVVETTRRWRAQELIGEVDRSDIVSASLPYVGTPRWKVAHLGLVGGRQVPLHVDGRMAVEFVEAVG